MINGYLAQFLDTGWYTEATLYYDGYIYWCEAQWNDQTDIIHFFVDKWLVEKEDDTYYHSLLETDGSLNWMRIYEIEDTDLDRIKKQFLKAPIFDGKSFWEVEKDVVWLEDGGPVIKQVSD